MLSAIVTLDSIRIYKTHEWLKKPTVYFHCNGENKTVLPDVKNANFDYAFNGEESWQVRFLSYLSIFLSVVLYLLMLINEHSNLDVNLDVGRGVFRFWDDYLLTR